MLGSCFACSVGKVQMFGCRLKASPEFRIISNERAFVAPAFVYICSLDVATESTLSVVCANHISATTSDIVLLLYNICTWDFAASAYYLYQPT